MTHVIINEAVPDTFLGEVTLQGVKNYIPPKGTSCFSVDSEKGDVYISINQPASTGSGFYIPKGQHRKIGPFLGITLIGVLAVKKAKAHIAFGCSYGK